MPINRVAWRNVHLYDASTGATLGGFYQKGSLTEATLVWILGNVLLVVEDHWTVRFRATGRTITPSSNPVVPGDYDIYSKGTIRVSDEAWFSRLISHAVSGREDAFRDGVRARDGKCVISGEVNDGALWGVWAGFQAAHVFPLEHENLWMQFNYGRWITNMDGVVGRSKINSLQNGLLMSENLHTRFDQYLFSINPDDSHKVITFMPNHWGIDGRILDPICRQPNHPDRVSDEVLRWHFRQCVLANMRGAGEPVFETDFPAGTDMMETLRAEPYGKERLEMELASRLRFMAGEGEGRAH
ncbi:HNH endonuclease-domain-containing protein [Lipomyces orientalis]|uniref:HNH endonuclease-domain-containing protein n=1 Tax=Lipomyces orientalis TaxID=1233043 RepID=A0ACC3TC84_9ASCO